MTAGLIRINDDQMQQIVDNDLGFYFDLFQEDHQIYYMSNVESILDRTTLSFFDSDEDFFPGNGIKKYVWMNEEDVFSDVPVIGKHFDKNIEVDIISSNQIDRISLMKLKKFFNSEICKPLHEKFKRIVFSNYKIENIPQSSDPEVFVISTPDIYDYRDDIVYGRGGSPNTINSSSSSIRPIPLSNDFMNGQLEISPYYMDDVYFGEVNKSVVLPIWKYALDSNYSAYTPAYLNIRKNLILCTNAGFFRNYDYFIEFMVNFINDKTFIDALKSEKTEEEYIEEFFVNAFVKKSHERVEYENSRIKSLQESIDQARSNIINMNLERNSALNFIKSSSEYIENCSSRIKQEIEEIKKINNVKEVKFANNSELKVFTNTLNCVNENTGQMHEIGEFEITINMSFDNAANLVRWQNLTRQVYGLSPNMNAPHIFNDGHACLGNAEIPFIELMSSLELSSAVGLAISFVENANVADEAGQYIYKWPLMNQEESS